MKDHLESLKCLRRCMAPKPGTDQFFRKGRSLYPARTEAFSTTCAVHIEDCEGWWLSGCRGSVGEHDNKKCYRRDHTQSACFLSTVFLVPKKDGVQRPVINLKSMNRFVHTEHFKMEGIHILKDLVRAGDWMTKVYLKDAYFMIPIHQEDRAFLKFIIHEDIPVQMSALRPSMCPMGLHKDPKVTRCSVETTGNATDCLHIQHSHPGRVHEAGLGACYRPDISSRELRFCDKQTKMCPGTHSVRRVPQVLSELSSTRTEPSSREGEKYQGRNSAPFGEQKDYSQKVVPASAPGSSVLPQAAIDTAEGVRAVRSGLLCPINPLHRGEGGAGMVSSVLLVN